MVTSQAQALEQLRRGQGVERLAERGWWRALAAARAMEGGGQAVGAWQLGHRLGAGGAGVVHSASHASGTRTAAIKILRDPLDPTSLHREARVIARLAHPGIVRLIDAGTALSGPWSVGEGLPWLAMERAAGGPLTPFCGVLPWHEVKQIVEAILGALAHAHARGVLHLDLKPDNVLVHRVATGFQVKLADFGLATFGLPAERRLQGTPAYMAPEQWRADSALFGPPTDIYALGCLVAALVRGAAPFSGDSSGQRLAHLSARPEIAPRIAAPKRLEAWLLRALAKDPAERFPTAAHARAALADLGPLVDATASAFEASAEATLFLDELDAAPAAEVADVMEALAVPQLRLPATGRRREPLPPVPPPGTAFWGAARAPIAGREVEQDVLWEALLKAVEGATVVRVGIRGHRGVGALALGRWLVERVHEEGACRVLRVASGQPHEDPLRMALIAGAGIAGDADDAHARICRWLGLAWDDPIAATCISAVERTVDAVEAWRQLIQSEAIRGPVVVAIEDARAAERLAPIWETLKGPVLAMFVRASTAVDVEVSLGRLPVDTVRVLLERAARLDPVLASQVAHHTGGLPGYALAVVANMIKVSALVQGPSGLTRLESVELGLPRDQAELWEERVQSAVQAPADLAALERGAVLGLVVATEEFWRVAHYTDPELPLRAATAGLGSMEDDGLWRFAPEARERLLSTARRGGRLEGHHAAIAAVVPADEPGRRAQHLLLAGLPERALADLLSEASHCLLRGDVQLALAAAEQWERCVEELELGADDPRRVDGALVSAEVYEALARREDVQRVVRGVLDRSQGSVRVRLLILLARARGMLDAYAESEALNLQALDLARELGDGELEAKALWNLSFALRFLGRGTEALGVLRESCAAWARCGTALGAAMAARGRASLALLDRDALAGAEGYARAYESFGRAGHAIDARVCAYLACNAYRWAGDLEAAWPLALRSVSAAPSNRRRAYALTLAGLAWARGHRELARREYELAMMRSPGDDETAQSTRLLLVASTAEESKVRELLALVLEGEAIGGHHLADMAWHCRHAAHSCDQVGRTELAAELHGHAERLRAAWMCGDAS
ncbi:MAG: protein kinase [Proteobacteria bacterium]|nr:protein kinase [Pseudomonadota bacterium]